MHHLLFIAHLLIPIRLTPITTTKIVSDIWTAGYLENASLTDMRRALVWISKESGATPQLGDCQGGLDKNSYCKSQIFLACGRGQLHKEWWEGHSCNEILSDPILDLRLWFHMFSFLKVYCKGNEKEALAAVASGDCKAYYTSVKVKGIVDSRERLVWYDR